jgi:hypothetical protein
MVEDPISNGAKKKKKKKKKTTTKNADGEGEDEGLLTNYQEDTVQYQETNRQSMS